MNDLKKVGKIATKAMLYFIAFSTFALVIGLVVENFSQVLLVAIMMGIALVLTKGKSGKVIDFFQSLSASYF